MVIFFLLSALFKEKCEFKGSHSERVLWKASVLLVMHVTDCPVYFCMKKKHILPAISHKLYQQPFFTDNKSNIFCMKTFSKYICCLKSLVGLRQTHACYFQPLVACQKSCPRCSGVRSNEAKHISIYSFYHLCHTKQRGHRFFWLFFSVCPEFASADGYRLHISTPINACIWIVLLILF